MGQTRHRSGPSAVLLLVAAVACGQGSGGVEQPGGEAARATPTMTAAELESSRTHHGEILVDGNGRTVYVFSADVPGPESACDDACLREWPVLDAPAAHAGMGVTETLIATVERPDGTEQITYHQRPLYYFAGDERVGDTEGHGVTSFGGVWMVLRPDGTPVRP